MDRLISMSQIYRSLEISCIQGHYGYYIIGFQPKQKSDEIWTITYENRDPIKEQPDNTGKTV